MTIDIITAPRFTVASFLLEKYARPYRPCSCSTRNVQSSSNRWPPSGMHRADSSSSESGNFASAGHFARTVSPFVMSKSRTATE